MNIAVNINYWAVLVCGIASMAVGFLWYGHLFGKMWISMMKFDKKKMEEAMKKGMGKTYALAFVSALVSAFILAHFIRYAGAETAMDGVLLGVMVWLGFFATTMLGMVFWEGKPFRLYLLNVSHYLVILAINSVILTVWV